MQKHFRARLGKLCRLAPGRGVYAEALNPHFGYFYTVKKTLARAKTKYQSLQLLDTDEFGKVLLLDNVTQVADSNDYQYHEPMVHPALCAHPHPESVLIIGGGDGGIAREVLKYPCVKRVELTELDEGVIAFSKKYLPWVHGGAFRDRRLHVTVTDGRNYVEAHRSEFDIVIMDLTDPSGPSTMLYTKEFFGAVRLAFRDRRGIFVMHSESPVSRPQAFSCIQATLRASFANVAPLYLYVQMYAVLWSMTLCSDAVDCGNITPAVIDSRLARYNIRGLEVYTGATHAAMRTAFPYITRLLSKRAPLITDAHHDFPDDFLSKQVKRKRV